MRPNLTDATVTTDQCLSSFFTLRNWWLTKNGMATVSAEAQHHVDDLHHTGERKPNGHALVTQLLFIFLCKHFLCDAGIK